MKPRFTQKFIADHINHDGEECLIWPYGRDSQGYARATMPGFKTRLAHRIILTLAKGCAAPQKNIARHICGNGHLGCVNPNHLVWGNQMENVSDARSHGTIIRGEARAISKLKSADIYEIRNLRLKGLTHRNIAKEFGVHVATIQAILNGRTWGHVK